MIGGFLFRRLGLFPDLDRISISLRDVVSAFLGANVTIPKEGLIRHAGLSNARIEDIDVAQKFFPVVSVQNRYNLVDRASEDVLEWCAKKGIGFIPWYPLAAGALAKPGSVLDVIARKKGATPSQIALSWVLKRSPAMLPIPGTGSVKHLEENVAAASIFLTDDEFKTLDAQGRAAK